MKLTRIRLVAVALVVLTAGLMFTATAQAWRRGQDEQSDPKNRGAAYNDESAIVCRNGVKVQVASSDRREYVLVVMHGTDVVASRDVTLKKRPVKTPPIGKRKFSRKVSLLFNQPLPAGEKVDIGFEGFDTFEAVVQDCLLCG
jgi:hypothetical protein